MNSKKNRDIFLNDNFDYVVDYDEILGNSINSYISDYSNMSIFSDNDNYTEIRIMSAGTDSRIIGKSVSEIKLALERDNFMTTDNAKSFGLIDKVVDKRS